MVFERHHSKRICFIPLALDTPKLCERFSFGLESFGLFVIDGADCRTVCHWYLGVSIWIKTQWKLFKVHLLCGLWVHPLKEGTFGLSSIGARKRLWFHHILLKLDPADFVRFPAEKPDSRRKHVWTEAAKSQQKVHHTLQNTTLTCPNSVRNQILWLI